MKSILAAIAAGIVLAGTLTTTASASTISPQAKAHTICSYRVTVPTIILVTDEEAGTRELVSYRVGETFWAVEDPTNIGGSGWRRLADNTSWFPAAHIELASPRCLTA